MDHLKDTASDYTLRIGPCPACEGVHEVTLSKLGWFAYRCGTVELRGEVDHFLATRRQVEAARDPITVH